MPKRFYAETAPAKNIFTLGDGMKSILQAASSKVISDISSWHEEATGYGFQRSRIKIGDISGHRFTFAQTGLKRSTLILSILDRVNEHLGRHESVTGPVLRSFPGRQLSKAPLGLYSMNDSSTGAVDMPYEEEALMVSLFFIPCVGASVVGGAYIGRSLIKSIYVKLLDWFSASGTALMAGWLLFDDTNGRAANAISSQVIRFQ